MAVITGTALDDVLLTTLSADALSALAGNDIILIGSAAAHPVGETINGLTGADRIWFTSGGAGETLTLRAGVTQVEAVLIADAMGNTSGAINLSINASALAASLSLVGNNGDNVITGGAGADIIIGNAGTDTLIGGAGNDRIVLRVNDATLDTADAGAATEGNTLVLLGAAAGTVVVDLGLGPDVDQLLSIDAVAEASAQTDFTHLDASDMTAEGVAVSGSAAANRIVGTFVADTLSGGANNDVLSGGGGDDVFLVASAVDHGTSEVISGGVGDDTLRFTSTTAAQTLTLRATVTSVEIVEIADATGDTSGTTALNVSAAAVKNALTLTGNAGNNSITGTALDDTIRGGAGNDTLTGGKGNDLYVVEAGADSTAADRISDSSGTDDWLIFTSASAGEILTIGAGVSGIDAVYIATVDADRTVDSSDTTALNVDASLAKARLKILGNDGANSLIGGQSHDTLEGGGGTDTLVGGLGADDILLDAAALDDADAGAAAEGNILRLAGNAAAAVLIDLSVAADVDQVDGGGVQSDFTHVDASALTGEGVVVTGSSLANRLTGSAQDDVFVYASAAHLTNDTIDGGEGTDGDVLRFASTTANQKLTLTTRVSNVEEVQIADASGATTGTTTLHVSASAMTAGISLVGNDGRNSLTGGRGDDTLNGNGGGDTLAGGAGNDVYEFDSQTDYFDGVTRDRITESATGGKLDKVLFSSMNAGDMLVLANLTGVELFEITGNAGTGIDAGALKSAGSFLGDDGDNTIIGGSGRDTIEGGLGGDSIVGGGGADRIIMTLGVEADAINAGAISEGNTLVLKTPDGVAVTVDLVDLSVIAGGDQVLAGDALVQSGFSHVDASLMGDSMSGVTVIGSSLANRIIGSGGDDLFAPGRGNDTVEGGAGADAWFVASQADYDGDLYTDSGGTPDDVIIFTSVTNGATLTIRNNTTGIDIGRAGGSANLNIDARAVDQPFGLSGNNGDNKLWGTRHGESFFIHGGKDYVNGGTGRDDYVIQSFAGWQATGTNHDTIVDSGRENEFYFADISGGTLVVGPHVTGMGIFVVSTSDLSEGGPFVRDNQTTHSGGLDVSAIKYGVLLAGNNGTNELIATKYNDTIEGYLGSDTITAGLGNDLVTMDVSGDEIDEINAGGYASGELNKLILKGTASDVLHFDLGSATDQMTAIGTNGEALVQIGFRDLDASAVAGFGVVVVASNRPNKVLGSAQDDAFVLRGMGHLAAGDLFDGGNGDDAVWFASTTAGQTLVFNSTQLKQVLSVESLVLADETGDTSGTTTLHINATGFKTGLKIVGNDGMNSLTGAGHDDVLIGNNGLDTLSGGAGNDVYLYELETDMDAAERIRDASGSADAIRFTSTMNGAVLVLSGDIVGVEFADLSDAEGSLAGTETIGVDASAMTRDLTLRGNAGANTLIGGSGDDTIFGNGGLDTIVAGAGADHVQMGIEDATRDDIDAGAASERNSLLVTGVAAGEMVWDLSSGTDQLVSIDGANDGNTIVGIADLDLSSVTGGGATVTGGAEVNRIVGTIEDDTLIVLAQGHFGASEALDGGEGEDRILFTSTTAGETLTLNRFVDGVEAVLISDDTGDTSGTTNLNLNADAVGNALKITGNDGDNAITGTDFADTIVGGAGADTITGGTGADRITTDVAVEDVVNGGTVTEGNEWVLVGAAGAQLVINLSLTGDQLSTGTLVQSGFIHLDASGVTGFGAQITGSAAGNRIAGTAEQDTILGGLGADRIAMDVTSSFDQIDAGLAAEQNELALTGTAPGVITIDLAAADQVVTGTLVQSGFMHIDASAMTAAGVDVAGTAEANRITGTEEQDTIAGGAGADVITMDVGSGNFDVIDAGGGNEGDVLRLVGTPTGVITLNLGVAPGGDQLTAVDGTGEAVVQAGFQHVDASGVVDSGIDVRGSGANNVLTGTAKGDRFAGLAGSDTIDVGEDGEADTIVYENVSDGVIGAGAAFSRDFIRNFSSGTDKVELSGALNGGAGNLDDIADDDTFVFATDERARFGDEHEALLVTAGKAKLASNGLLYSSSFSSVAAVINKAGVTAVVGDDGLIVVQGKSQTGVYYYQEAGGAGVSGSELTLLGVFEGHLDAGDFIFG